MLITHLNTIRIRRAKRARARTRGVATKPRLSVFRSNRYVYAQLIDDNAGKVLVSVSTRGAGKNAKTKQAEEMGKTLAEKAKSAGISAAVFDRGRYKFHGRIKALAESARAGGLRI